MEAPRKVILRAVTESDAPALREILAASPHAAQWIDAPAMQVAVAAECVVGFVAYRVVLGEGEILNIAVEPSFRRKGVASQLLGSVLPLASAWFLEVRESNRSAQSVYVRCGFSEVGRRPRYYADGEDALLFRWP